MARQRSGSNLIEEIGVVKKLHGLLVSRAVSE